MFAALDKMKSWVVEADGNECNAGLDKHNFLHLVKISRPCLGGSEIRFECQLFHFTQIIPTLKRTKEFC